ncbi:MAG: DUF4340 domain-containing protein [Candidatus Polarisedimenticolaceae bacterium]|nr:DUF4340 domain-containing protein [Candidatus Polarisedimenticolaceae bacterium]
MLINKQRLLLLLLPLLVAITWFQPGLDKPQIHPLTQLPADRINTIQIRKKSGTLIKLQRESGGWMMQSPTPGAANSQRINELLGISQTESHLSFPAEDEKLAEYGLSPPRIVLQLNELQLLFGDNDPVYQRRYVKVAGQIHLIDDGFQHHLLAKPSAFSATGE